VKKEGKERLRGNKGRGGGGRDGIWPTQKFWRGAPYGLGPRKALIRPSLGHKEK